MERMVGNIGGPPTYACSSNTVPEKCDLEDYSRERRWQARQRRLIKGLKYDLRRIDVAVFSICVADCAELCGCRSQHAFAGCGRGSTSHALDRHLHQFVRNSALQRKLVKLVQLGLVPFHLLECSWRCSLVYVLSVVVPSLDQRVPNAYKSCHSIAHASFYISVSVEAGRAA